MVYDFENIRSYLQSEFENRVRKNPRYSLRSFAQLLRLHPAEISQVFHGRRSLSLPSAVKVSKALGLSPEESRHLMWLLQKERGQRKGLEVDFIEDNRPEIPLEQFAKISEWSHFAVLSLIDTRDFQWNAKWIAKRLGLAQSEAAMVMRELESTGLVNRQASRGRQQTVKVSSPIPSQVIRRYHRQMLEKAISSLDEVPMDRREYQSLGLALDSRRLAELKKDLDAFTDRMIRKYHSREARDVYQIQICVFPLTKEESK